MTLHSAGDKMESSTGNSGPSATPPGPAMRVTHAPTFVIGNKAFFIAVKRALDAAGGYHIIGAFRTEDLRQSLRRSLMLGQKPMVCVIHEPTGERKMADQVAHAVLETYPNCGIVLISGDEIEAAAERRIGAHDFNVVVVSDSVTRNPKALAAALRSAMSAAGNDLAA